MIIREQQLDTLAEGWERSKRAVFVSRLRAEFPAQLQKLSPEALEDQVRVDCYAAQQLDIREFEHVYRFLRLRFLPASAWSRPEAQEMLFRVLMDTSVEAVRRLEYIERNIVLCAPSRTRLPG